MPNLSISQVLDRIKSRHDLKSDYAVSKLLESSTQLVANWRNGRSLPDERSCQKLAELAGLDADVLIAQMNAQRAKDEDSRAIWQRIAERLQMVPQALAAAFFAVLFATSFVAGDAHAASACQPQANQNDTVTKLYIVSIRLLARCAAWWAQIQSRILSLRPRKNAQYGPALSAVL